MSVSDESRLAGAPFPDKGIAFDAEGRCVYASPSAETMLRLSGSDLLGFGWLRFIDPRDLMRLMLRILSSATDGGAITFRWRVGHATIQTIQVELTPLRQFQHHGLCMLAAIERAGGSWSNPSYGACRPPLRRSLHADTER